MLRSITKTFNQSPERTKKCESVHGQCNLNLVHVCYTFLLRIHVYVYLVPAPHNLALNPPSLNVIGPTVLKILGSLVAPDILTAEHLDKDVVDEGQHVLRLHAPSLELERSAGTCPVKGRSAVGGEEGEVFPDVRIF